jgi:hypothetical protein
MLRAGKKAKMKEEVKVLPDDQEEMDDEEDDKEEKGKKKKMDEARFKKGQDVGKPGMNFAKIAKAAGKRYGSEEAGKRVAGAVLKKVLAKEEVEYSDEEIETVLDNYDQLVEMSKSMAYATGTKKAMQMTGDKPPLEKATIKKGHEIAKAMLRKEEAEQVDELKKATLSSYVKKASQDAVDKANNASAENEYGSPVKGDELEKKSEKRLAGIKKAATKLAKEEFESFEDYDELVESKPFEYSVEEYYTFGDYLTTAKKLVGEEQAIELANNSYNSKSTDLFLEAFGRDDIEKKVKMHMNAGHQVSTPKYSTKGGEFHAEYVVTDKESGIRRKYIHHGSSRKVENMGAAGKRD